MMERRFSGRKLTKEMEVKQDEEIGNSGFGINLNNLGYCQYANRR